MIWEWFATLGPVKWVAWVMVMTAIPLLLLLVLWLFLPFGIYGSKRRLERLIFLNQQILTELVRLRRTLEGPDTGPSAPAEDAGAALEAVPPGGREGVPLPAAGQARPPAAHAGPGPRPGEPRQTGKAEEPPRNT